MFKRKNVFATIGMLVVLGLTLVVGTPNFLMAKEKTKLVMWDTSVAPIEHELFVEKVGQFMKENPNIEIEVSAYPDRVLRDKLYVSIAGGVAPNLMNGLPEQEIWMKSGICVPAPKHLQEYIEEHDYLADDLYDIEGKYYWFSPGIDSPTYFYNTKLWQEAGLSEQDIPETWSELREVARELTKYDSKENIVQAGFAYNMRTNGLFYDLLLQLGGHMWSEDGRTIVCNSPEGVKAWQFLYDLMYVDKVNSPGFLGYSEAFGTGKAAITWCYSWLRDSIRSNYPDIEFAQFINPLPDDRTFGSPNFWAYGRCDSDRTFVVLSSTGEKEDASWRFLESVYKDNEMMRKLADNKRIIPLKKELADLPEYQKGWYAVARRLMFNTVYAPMESHLYNELLTDAENAILREHKPIKEVLDEVVEIESIYLEDQPYYTGRDKY